MFTSRIETFHSLLLLKAPKTKLFLSTMEKRMYAAILEWNESHIPEAFLQTDEQDPDKKEIKIKEMRDSEANWRRNWFERVWERLIKASAPQFPDLDAASDEENL